MSNGFFFSSYLKLLLVSRLIVLFLETFRVLYKLLIFSDFIGLQKVNHLKDVSRLFTSDLCLHPLHYHTGGVDALNLLQESPVDLPTVVASRSDTDVVDVHLSNYILASTGSVLADKNLIAMARCNKLVFAGLAAINVIVGVEEGSIGKHPGHLPPLVNYEEASVLIDFFHFDHFVILWHDLMLLVEELDELLRGHSIRDDLQHCKGRISFPTLMYDKRAIFIFVDNRHVMSTGQHICCQI